MKYEKIGNIESEGCYIYEIAFSLNGERKRTRLNACSPKIAKSIVLRHFLNSQIYYCRKVGSNAKTFINGIEFVGGSVRRV